METSHHEPHVGGPDDENWNPGFMYDTFDDPSAFLNNSVFEGGANMSNGVRGTVDSAHSHVVDHSDHNADINDLTGYHHVPSQLIQHHQSSNNTSISQPFSQNVVQSVVRPFQMPGQIPMSISVSSSDPLYEVAANIASVLPTQPKDNFYGFVANDADTLKDSSIPTQATNIFISCPCDNVKHLSQEMMKCELTADQLHRICKTGSYKNTDYRITSLVVGVDTSKTIFRQKPERAAHPEFADDEIVFEFRNSEIAKREFFYYFIANAPVWYLRASNMTELPVSLRSLKIRILPDAVAQKCYLDDIEEATFYFGFLFNDMASLYVPLDFVNCFVHYHRTLKHLSVPELVMTPTVMNSLPDGLKYLRVGAVTNVDMPQEGGPGQYGIIQWPKSLTVLGFRTLNCASFAQLENNGSISYRLPPNLTRLSFEKVLFDQQTDACAPPHIVRLEKLLSSSTSLVDIFAPYAQITLHELLPRTLERASFLVVPLNVDMPAILQDPNLHRLHMPNVQVLFLNISNSETYKSICQFGFDANTPMLSTLSLHATIASYDPSYTPLARNELVIDTPVHLPPHLMSLHVAIHDTQPAWKVYVIRLFGQILGDHYVEYKKLSWVSVGLHANFSDVGIHLASPVQCLPALQSFDMYHRLHDEPLAEVNDLATSDAQMNQQQQYLLQLAREANPTLAHTLDDQQREEETSNMWRGAARSIRALTDNDVYATTFQFWDYQHNNVAIYDEQNQQSVNQHIGRFDTHYRNEACLEVVCQLVKPQPVVEEIDESSTHPTMDVDAPWHPSVVLSTNTENTLDTIRRTIAYECVFFRDPV